MAEHAAEAAHGAPGEDAISDFLSAEGLFRPNVQQPQACFIGPHCTGKTTAVRHVVQLLRQDGVRIDSDPRGADVTLIQEVARKLMDSLGISGADLAEPSRFTYLQTELVRRYAELAQSAPRWLSDRSAIDPMAYMLWREPDAYAAFKKLVDPYGSIGSLYRGSTIYLFSPLESILDQHGRTVHDGTRLRSTLDELEQLHACFEKVLKEYNLPYRSVNASTLSVDEVRLLFQDSVVRPEQGLEGIYVPVENIDALPCQSVEWRLCDSLLHQNRQVIVVLPSDPEACWQLDAHRTNFHLKLYL